MFYDGKVQSANHFTCIFSARGVFYSDSGQSFDNVLLYGNELELFQLELMIYVLFVCLFDDTLLAVLVAAIFHVVSRAIKKIRSYNNILTCSQTT